MELVVFGAEHMRLACSADSVRSQWEAWRMAQADAYRRARRAGLVVCCDSAVLGVDGLLALYAVPCGIPVMSVVVDDCDLSFCRELDMQAANSGLLRRSFSCADKAAQWTYARARALYRSRQTPGQSPAWPGHVHVHAWTDRLSHPVAAPSRLPMANS